MIYLVCSTLLMIGVLGLLAQMLLGGAHAGHLGHHTGAGHGHGGGGHSGQSHAGHSHAGTQGQHTHGHQHGGRGRGTSFLLTLLSPLTFFSLCLGTGATGLLLKHSNLSGSVVAVAALVGGIVFYGLIIRPLWNFVFQFASTPSTALEGTIAREAEALTSFDAGGKGLVRLTIDGQLVRILATLETDDRAVAVRPGDRLTVTSVDGHTNSCRVARL